MASGGRLQPRRGRRMPNRWGTAPKSTERRGIRGKSTARWGIRGKSTARWKIRGKSTAGNWIGRGHRKSTARVPFTTTASEGEGRGKEKAAGGPRASLPRPPAGRPCRGAGLASPLVRLQSARPPPVRQLVHLQYARPPPVLVCLQSPLVRLRAIRPVHSYASACFLQGGWMLHGRRAFGKERKEPGLKNWQQMRIFWESKNFEGQTNLTEPWYGTSYSVEAVPPSIIQKWVEKAPEEDLHLPKQNIFIPRDLSLKSVEEMVSFPAMLRKTPFSRLWYKPDTMFFTPKAYIKMDFHCPLSQSSPESAVLTDVFTRLLMDYLNDYAYDAQVAGLYYAVKPNDTGFQVTMVGFNDKMRTLLETVIGKIAEFEVKVDRFSVIKEAMTKEYENFKFRQPYQQVLYYCSLILEDQAWPWDEEYSALSHLEASDLEFFLPQLLSKTFIECYFAGNIEPNEAKNIIHHVEDVLFNAPISVCKPLSPSQHLAKRIVKLEKGLRYYYPAMCSNHQDENSALLHYIQTHQDNVKQNVLLQLLALVGKQPAFHQLRSVEQLGYIALLRQRNDSGVRGLQFIIQSTVKDPANLDARVENFLMMFEGTLYQMSDAEFKSNVSALIDMKLEKYKNIREESAFFWGEISEGTLKFDRKQEEVAALRELKKEELIDFFNDHVKVNAPQKKILSIQVYGGLHSAEYETIVQNAPPPQSCEITDIYSFRRSRPLYGSFRGGVGQMKL